jgi:hypothetical protein
MVRKVEPAAMTKPAWKSPKTWVKSAAILAAAWVVAYLLTQSVSGANTLTAIFLIVGFAGLLIT